MIDHITLNVRDLEASKAFYQQSLRPIGYELTLDFLGGCGFAADQKPDFFLAERGQPSAPVHVAFLSPNRQTVDAFHKAALAAGGRDNGPPGLRRVNHEFELAKVRRPAGSSESKQRMTFEEFSREYERERYAQFIERIRLKPAGRVGSRVPAVQERVDVYLVGCEQPYTPELMRSDPETLASLRAAHSHLS